MTDKEKNPLYSLRHYKNGRSREKNHLSPALTDEDFTLDEVNEHIRAQFETAREAIKIARKYRCDLDISTAHGLLEISLYT